MTEWIAYNELEPIGEVRDDLRAGIVASTIAEAHRNPKKRKRPFEAKEFMPDFEKRQDKEEQTPDQQLAIIEQFNLAMGGKDLRNGRNWQIDN